MHSLTMEDAKGLINIIHESLGCNTHAAYQKLVSKLRHLTGGTCMMSHPETSAVSGWKYSQVAGVFRHSIEDSRTKVILNYALPHIHKAQSRVANVKIQKQRKSKATLSHREKEVLQWMSEGKCAWDIARILNITERTVYYHSQNITRKLEATSRSHAVTIAIKRGIIALH